MVRLFLPFAKERHLRASLFPLLLATGVLVGCVTDDSNASDTANNRAQCSEFGFEPGTDAFANCMMKLKLRQDDKKPPSHFDLIDKYKRLSINRQGDDRYPVCSAGNMQAELDIETGKWVGPDCQLAE